MEHAILSQGTVNALTDALSCVGEDGGLVVPELIREVCDDFFTGLKILGGRAGGDDFSSAVRAWNQVRMTKFETEAALNERCWSEEQCVRMEGVGGHTNLGDDEFAVIERSSMKLD